MHCFPILSDFIPSKFSTVPTIQKLGSYLGGLLAGVLLVSQFAAGAGPAVTLSPTSLTFGQQVVGTQSPIQTVTLTNSGTAKLHIISIAASAGFAETTTCKIALAVKASCTLSVTFSPTAAGTITGSIKVTDNAPGSPQSISLTGTAVNSTGIDVIQHIVFIIKENRTLNNYFGTFPGANGATSGTVSNGQVILLEHTPDRVRDMGHAWKDATTAINGGLMNQFDLVQDGNIGGDYMSMSQLYQTDIPNTGPMRRPSPCPMPHFRRCTVLASRIISIPSWLLVRMRLRTHLNRPTPPIPPGDATR